MARWNQPCPAFGDDLAGQGHGSRTAGAPRQPAIRSWSRVATSDDDLILLTVPKGEPVQVVWPSGWAAWRVGGRAELVARDGSVVAREGDVLDDLGGGVGVDDAFQVCVIGG
jgi:hypothetical protein